MEQKSETALVTGGSGYVGSWVIGALLQRGYRVRATLRDLAREGEVRAAIAKMISADESLSFHRADLLSDDGWDAAVGGVDYVLHVASPMGVSDNVRPAREGTMRVLRASAKAGVKRVVVTSSTAAASRPRGEDDKPVDESVWTNPDEPGLMDYARAKTLAERDAWDFMRTAPSSMSLTTLLPSQIQGPVLGADFSQSVGIVAMMLSGKMPAAPRLGFNIVDIRDLADLHVLVMTAPQAAGERFIASADFLWFAEMGRILRNGLAARGAKAPKSEIPDFIVRAMGAFNPQMRALSGNLGRRATINVAKAENVLGWRSRPGAQSILDGARSLIEAGLV